MQESNVFFLLFRYCCLPDSHSSVSLKLFSSIRDHSVEFFLSSSLYTNQCMVKGKDSTTMSLSALLWRCAADTVMANTKSVLPPTCSIHGNTASRTSPYFHVYNFFLAGKLTIAPHRLLSISLFFFRRLFSFASFHWCYSARFYSSALLTLLCV